MLSFYEIVFLALALSMDACVVLFSQGLILEGNIRKNAYLLSFATGFFQFLMPLCGYFLAGSISKFFLAYGKWIVFVIFMTLGVRFVASAMRKEEFKITCLDVKCLLMIAVATSIDAFAAGIGLRFGTQNIFECAVLIGSVTFLMSILGYLGGCFFKRFPAHLMQTLGGLILITLALKSL